LATSIVGLSSKYWLQGRRADHVAAVDYKRALRVFGLGAPFTVCGLSRPWKSLVERTWILTVRSFETVLDWAPLAHTKVVASTTAATSAASIAVERDIRLTIRTLQIYLPELFLSAPGPAGRGGACGQSGPRRAARGFLAK
jgi:hypothetical protein